MIETLVELLAHQPLGVEKLWVHPHHEHLLIIRPIENRNRAGRWQPLHWSPQKRAQALFFAWRFETVNGDALRVDARHDVFDRAVFSSRIEGLKDNNQRVLLAGPKYILLFGEFRDILEE